MGDDLDGFMFPSSWLHGAAISVETDQISAQRQLTSAPVYPAAPKMAAPVSLASLSASKEHLQLENPNKFPLC